MHDRDREFSRPSLAREEALRRSSHRRHEEHDARIADERLEIAVAILFNHNGCFRTRDGTKNYASHFSAEEQATAREIYRNEYAGNLSK